MATDRTPKYKRIKRAETGRDDWKLKAIERREEIEKLRKELKSKEDILLETQNQIQELKDKLILQREKIFQQDAEITCFKKKLI
jgi:chromosome segregation ATPase